MDREWRPEANVKPWGPFLGNDFKNEPVTHADVITTSIVGALTLVNLLIAAWLGYKQCHNSRSPLRSVYIWMIWLEMGASLVMAVECFLFVLKFIRPSFYFYSTILLMWSIQVQLLLQIIINRIRLIVPDRHHSRMIMIVTAVIVTVINVSVFNIWVPARLQINYTYQFINDIWDRMEKIIYLFIDAALNWYFLKTVKANLINNGLQKYDKLFHFNQRIILLSLLMDVMIIAAMSIPNSFIYIQFHPLAYLVKLNIEMTMANLIKHIAISSTRRRGCNNQTHIADEFHSSNLSISGHKFSATRSTHKNRSSPIELSSFGLKSTSATQHEVTRPGSLVPAKDQIKVTKVVHVISEPIGLAEPIERIMYSKETSPGDRSLVHSKSVDDVTDGMSVKTEDIQGRDENDDETSLVAHPQKRPWPV